MLLYALSYQFDGLYILNFHDWPALSTVGRGSETAYWQADA